MCVAPQASSVSPCTNVRVKDSRSFHRRVWTYYALLACGIATGCGVVELPLIPSGEPAADEATVLTVNVARAQYSENVAETASSFGTLKARRSSSLAFARGGRVAKVLFDVGAYVAEGDKIAELDQGQLADQQEDLDSVLAAQREELALFESQNDVQRARRKEEEIAELLTQQQRLTREFERGYIVAPYRGVIAERTVEVGDTVPAGRPFFRVLEDAPPIIELNVPLSVARSVPVGEEVWARHASGVLQANVRTKSPEVDASSRTQRLTLNVTNSDQLTGWSYGETVEVQFFLSTTKSGYWLPYSALHSEAEDLWSVFVLRSQDETQVIERRIVKLVQLEDSHALVRGNLQVGDLFVVDGLHRVVPGQVVQANLVVDEYRQLAPARTDE